jgi:hypothetical protein
MLQSAGANERAEKQEVMQQPVAKKMVEAMAAAVVA